MITYCDGQLVSFPSSLVSLLPQHVVSSRYVYSLIFKRLKVVHSLPPFSSPVWWWFQVSWAGWTILLYFSTFWGQFKIPHTFLYIIAWYTCACTQGSALSSCQQLAGLKAWIFCSLRKILWSDPCPTLISFCSALFREEVKKCPQ